MSELDDLEKLCEWLEQQPHKAAYVQVRGIAKMPQAYLTALVYKPLRDGVIFYSSGWGWRLRKDWRAALAAKRAALATSGEGGVGMRPDQIVYAECPYCSTRRKFTNPGQFQRHTCRGCRATAEYAWGAWCWMPPMRCARCAAFLNNLSPGFSITTDRQAVCTPCLQPGEEVARAKHP